ncbi:MAG TPA: hypothetical protein VGE74_28750 [Gemmata sp.]
MGLGYCQKCGSDQGVALACRHVVAAITASAPRLGAEYREYRDEGEPGREPVLGAAFCRECIDRWSLPPSGTPAMWAVVDAAAGEVEGVCGGCLRRWLAAPDAEPGAAPDPAT